MSWLPHSLRGAQIEQPVTPILSSEELSGSAKCTIHFRQDRFEGVTSRSLTPRPASEHVGGLGAFRQLEALNNFASEWRVIRS